MVNTVNPPFFSLRVKLVVPEEIKSIPFNNNIQIFQFKSAKYCYSLNYLAPLLSTLAPLMNTLAPLLSTLAVIQFFKIGITSVRGVKSKSCNYNR